MQFAEISQRAAACDSYQASVGGTQRLAATRPSSFPLERETASAGPTLLAAPTTSGRPDSHIQDRLDQVRIMLGIFPTFLHLT